MCGGFALAVAAQGGVPATVYQTANVRSGPDTRYEIVGQLAQGDTTLVTGRDEEGSWLQVTLPSGEVGWLPLFVLTLEGSLEDVPVVDNVQSTPVIEEEVTVSAYGRVNVRSEPAISGEIVGQLDVGDTARATARNNDDNDWLLIANETLEGWVAFFTVRVEGDLTSLPILVPDSSGAELIPPSVLIRTRFNARLHPVPELDSPTILIVPFNSEVTPIARSDDGRWLLVGYEGQTGWGIADLFAVRDDRIEQLPVLVPEVTPEATPPL
jgi:uncharacterized protein YgiM (DUF1202 family)